MPQPKRILFWNGAHIGDLILSTAILPVLKKAFQNIEIGFCIGTWASPVLENHHFISHLHYFDHPILNRSKIAIKKKKRRAHKQWNTAVREIRELQYDLAVDLYYFYRANGGKLLRAAQVPCRVGYWGSPAHYTFTDKIFWDYRLYHMVENHGKILEGIGVPSNFLSELKPTLSYFKDNLCTAPFSNYFLFHVGSGEKWRRWPPLHWKKFSELVSELGKPIILLGNSPEEFELCKSLENPKKEIYYMQTLSWGSLIPLFHKAHAFIGLESMGGHLAAALNKPALLLYGNYTNIFRWRPYNDCCMVISPEEKIEIKNVAGHRRAMEAITPERVFSQLQVLLKNHSH